MQFKEVVGQRALKKQFIQEINEDKISHAQLFTGRTGYGSLALALAFVQYLFCENRQTEDSCGECSGCRKVKNLQHPDLHFSFPVVLKHGKVSDLFLDKWRNQILEKTPYFSITDWTTILDPKGPKPIINVDESQNIIKKLSLKSFEGGYKVMIIWMADRMNLECANKLLKILEEPPCKTLFIVINEDTEALLPTILSRCQLVTIPKIDANELENYLKRTHSISSSALQSILGRVEGDLISALGLCDTEVENIMHQQFVQLMRVSYKKDVIAMLDWAEEISSKNADEQKNFIVYCLHMFRQSMLKNYTADQLTRISDEENDFLGKFSRFITGNNVSDFMQTMNESYYHLERNANTKLLFTNLCFKVMRYIHFA